MAVIPIGKHKGRNIAEVVVEDPSYIDWLLQQPFFAKDHKSLYNLARQAMGYCSEQTPEHNKMQLRFLEDAYRMAVAAALGYKSGPEVDEFKERRRRGMRECAQTPEQVHAAQKELPYEFAAGKPKFEEISDVHFYVGRRCFPDEQWLPCLVAVELKPLLGDDYPAVLRQVRAQQKRYNGSFKVAPPAGIWVVLVDSFESEAATFEQAAQVFAQSGIRLMLSEEVEQHLLECPR